jgi:glycopeptide antibiotics resistance protein
MTRPVEDLARHVRPHHTPLGAYIAVAYTLLIVHASLNPFTGWRLPDAGVLAFLGAWPRYLTAFDIAVNFAAYVPFGVLLGVALARRLRHPDLLLAVTAAGALLSLSLEALQSLLPGRFASIVDLLANASGAALGALIAPWLRHPPVKRQVIALRHALFLQGRLVDWGLALLALWLLAQTNPALPLMASWAPQAWPSPAPKPFSAVEMLSVTLNAYAAAALIGILLQPARRPWLWLLALLATVCAVKWLAAQWLVKPALALGWASREAVLGSGYGLLLAAFADLARLRVQVAAAGLALALGLTLAWAAHPQVASPAVALAAFSWRGGHLLTFTGLTQAAAGVWPWLALGYLGLFYRRLGA